MRQKTQSNAFGFSKYILLAFIVCVCSSAGQAAPNMAPVNPEFTAWQAEAEKTSTIEVQKEQGYTQTYTLGYIPSPVNMSHLIVEKGTYLEGSIVGLPSSYDLRTLGYVTPVKDQGSCGSCWAFATYGSFESWLKKSLSETWDFSENHLKNYSGFDRTPCEGGNEYMSLAYLARWSGPVDEVNDPYHDWDDRPSPGGAYKKCLEKVLWFFTDDDIKNAVMTYGGLYVPMYIDVAYYNSSLYTYYYNGSNVANHAVTLIGWDDNKVVPGAPGNGAWLIKNSWGSGWGDSGYFWISYYDTQAVSYATAYCGASSPYAYAANYQYDPLGLTASLGYDNSTGWAANIFVPSTSGKLNAIGLHAVDDAMTYEIYIYDTYSGGTFLSLLAAVSGTFANAGYYTVPLIDQINLTAGNNFAIVVKFTSTTGYKFPIPIETDITGYSSGATASSGQSYISSNGTTFHDITGYSGYEKTNVCIRGLTALTTVKTLNMLPSTNGTTIPIVGVYPYPSGTIVDISAIPNAHYHFVNWTGTAVTAGKVASPTSANTTVQMDGNYTLMANFALNKQSLTMSAGDHGTVTTPGIGTYLYDYGSTVNIIASADTDYHFINWTGTAVTAGKVANPTFANTTVLVDANYTLQANFAVDRKLLKVSATVGGGTVTTPGIGTYDYDLGGTADIAAVASGNYHFTEWTGTAVTAGKVANPYSPVTTVTMSKDYAIRANFAAVPAFPGAEGSGRWATGGRGGNVYEVTNLSNSGPGSIVDALSEGNRTIVFRVSGTIELDGVKLYPKSNTTIAGQTAPGDGICIKGRIHIKDDVHDIIIRYIRVRVDEGAANSSGDAIDIDEGSNIIIDHVTASYARDEGISCQEDSGNVTVQWCIISEALTYESHSYGSLVRGQEGQEKTYHHNLYAHNNNRNPRPGNYVDYLTDPEGLSFDFRNNVIYNWKGSYGGYNEDASMVSRYSFIGNAYIRGPESTISSGYKGFREKCKVGYGYFADNSYEGVVPADPWSIVLFADMTAGEIDAYKAHSYLVPMEWVTTSSPEQAKMDVLAEAGASFPKRDIIDKRIINDTIYKTGHSIATTAAQPEGGWPTLNSLPAPDDSDHDGMPNTWETDNGLNPDDANDRNDYDLDGDYTNLEVYINGLLEVSATAPYTYWIQRYDGTASSSDYAMDIAVDSAGNAYVTGYASDVGANYGFATIKYAPDGTVLWTNKYNRKSTSYDYAMAITVDESSNIIVAGYNYTSTSGYDGAVVKYNSAGTKLWAKSYNFTGTTDDRFYDVSTDASGNVYAAGRANGDGLLVKYTSGGTLLWAKKYNGSGSGYDALYQVAIDGDSVYACGESAGAGTGQDCLTIKYSTGGNLLWANTLNGAPGSDDWLEAIAIDSAGDVYVTGSAGSDYVTMKSSSDGNSLWISFYSGTTLGWDESCAIAVSSDGNVVVTGCSEGDASEADAVTVKYNSSTGAQIWAKSYNGAGNLSDYAEVIAADGLGNVYIHGSSVEEVGSLDYLTICYDSNGTEKWKRNYDGPACMTDTGSAIALYGDNEIFVTGSSMSSASNYDYATIKYIMSNCPAAPQGDLNGDCQVDFADFVIFANNWGPGKISGQVVGWGDNWAGKATPPEDNDFTAISACDDASLGLKADGSIAAWGDNLYGQRDVPEPNTGFTAIACGSVMGGSHSLGLKADGSIAAWGGNFAGQCDVPLPNTGFTAIAAGDTFSLGLKADGSIVAWGSNWSGQCNVPEPNTGFVAIAAGSAHSLGLKADGSIVAWGDNYWGQCDVPLPNTGFTAIAAKWGHSLGLKADGSIAAWGDNSSGQCNVPEPNTGFTAIAAGGAFSLGLKADGSIAAWGNNDWNQATPPAGNDYIAIAAGTVHGLAIKGSTYISKPAGDMNNDYNVDFADFAMFADGWLECDMIVQDDCWQ